MTISLQNALASHKITDFSTIGSKHWTYLSYDAQTGWNVVKFEGLCGFVQQILRMVGFYVSTQRKTIEAQLANETNVPPLLLGKIQRRVTLPHLETKHSELIGNTTLTFAVGDITHQGVDAIVNAANRACLGGSGVDRAIHDAAGPNLLNECRDLPEIRPGVRCETGEVVYTNSHDLAQRGIQYIIHTVGPDMREGPVNVDELLRNCYVNSLSMAREIGARSIAFPAISTGIYGFPKERANQIAQSAIKNWIKENPDWFVEVKLIYFNVQLLNQAKAVYEQGNAE